MISFSSGEQYEDEFHMAVEQAMGFKDKVPVTGQDSQSEEDIPEAGQQYAMMKKPGETPDPMLEKDKVTQGAAAGVSKRPYQNVPDNLMGFSKSGQNKAYEDQIEVILSNGDKFKDSVKGLNKEHALERAIRNWGEDSIIKSLKE